MGRDLPELAARCLLTSALSLAAAGCMTVQSKLAAEHQGGHPYSGITGDVYAIRCMSELPSAAKRSDGTSYWLSVPLATLLTTFFIIDAPFSILADTLLLPVDVVAKPQHERWDPFTKPCAGR